MAEKRLIEASIIDRVVQGVKYIFTGKADTDWFGPGQPLPPVAQEAAVGRQLDYPVLFNTMRTPRQGEAISFAQLRQLADSYDLLRLVIETRKDQMEKLNWSFKPKDKKAKPDARCERLNEFFQFPDQEHNWKTWLRALLEDLFVIDAPTLYPRMTNGGELFSLELVDGSTIKRTLDVTGRTPLPPEVAYQQIIKGMQAVNYSRDELIYMPRNVRTHKVYGYSPVEQVMMTVNIALRRQMSQLSHYTEGNIPEALIGVPPDWNPDQIKQFQEYWDMVLAGNIAAKSRARFVPGGTTPYFTKEAMLADKFDEWLARIICFAFSISPQALVAQMNRATAETADEQAKQEGLLPVMNWVKQICDYVAWKYFGFKDLEFSWEEEEAVSPKDQAEILTKLVQAKIITDDEARDVLGREPLSDEQREQLAPAPVVGVDEDGNPLPPGTPPPAGGKAPPVGAKPGGGGKAPPKAKADASAAPEVAAKLGKAQGGSGPRKLKPISRARTAHTKTVSKVSKLLRKALKDVGERVAAAELLSAQKALSSSDGVRRLLVEFTLDELRDIAPALVEALEDMAADGGKVALAQVVNDFTQDQLSQVNRYAVEYAKDRAAELVTNIEQSTRDMLRDVISDAESEGWSNDRLAKELQDHYALSDERADVIARTETAYADIQGNLEGYRASGLVEGKEWIISQDDYCDECQALEGVVVPLGANYPGGIEAPPLHPNCRCDVLPVLNEE